MSSIRAATRSAGVGAGASRASGEAQRSAKPRSSPAATVKDARIVESSTSSATGDVTPTRPAPNVRAPPGSRRTSGRISPYSGRGASSMTKPTSPLTPSTLRRISCGASYPSAWPRWPSANAIVSRSRAVPESVRKIVSITSVPGR